MSLQSLAIVRDMTGKVIRLGMFEEVSGIRQTPTMIVLGINRAKVTETRFEYRIKQRGTTLYTFALTDQGWELLDTMTVWWSSDEAHAKSHRIKPDSEWAEMCYRPGTSRNPLDNNARKAQGYTS